MVKLPLVYHYFLLQSSSVPASLDESEESGSASKKRKLFSQSLDETISKDKTDNLQPLYGNLPLPFPSQPLYSNLPPVPPPCYVTPPGRKPPPYSSPSPSPTSQPLYANLAQSQPLYANLARSLSTPPSPPTPTTPSRTKSDDSLFKV